MTGEKTVDTKTRPSCSPAAFLQETKTSGEGEGVLAGGGDSKWLISISLWSLEDNDVLAAGTNTLRCSGHIVLTRDRKQSK